ncbi:S41 family peptidase [Kordiimonas marina]|uniref:S41 family peptidase n=1 Tax=Kordiimonas marina TaxID=2872312 RepID=UPI001FF3A7ED|nr:S41 family peptidase [Kordiimonas marina]MCJ9427881.1 S41 family peptidase [Kordiimonas marina]
MRKLVMGVMTALMMAVPVHAASKATAQQNQDEFYEQLDLLMRIFERVRTEYVDPVDDKKVIEAAIQGMLHSLDPHSTYLNPDIYQQVRVQMEGEYGGLGIEVQMDNGLVKVVSPIDDTPAALAGIKGGDYITQIDGKPVMGLTLTEAVKMMRGPIGSPIIVTILRDGVKKPFDMKIIRKKILVHSVRHHIEDGTVGYIRITTFNMQTGAGVEKAIKDLKAKLGNKLDGVILDLRNNPGGLLDEAIRVSDAFLDHGEIVSTRGRKRQNNNRWYATPGDLLDGLPMVVLTNAYSASASEIVAGALQDHRRAVILGDRTFGKGTVQSEIRLGRKGDSAIRLTTARYFTPSGRSIQERGIEPDIEDLTPMARAEAQRREANLSGHLTNDQQRIDRAGEQDPLTPAEQAAVKEAKAEENAKKGAKAGPEVDIQLQHAIKLLKNMSSLPKSQVAEVR